MATEPLTNVLLTACKCGHSGGAHAQGSQRNWRNGSLWACYAPGCECCIFETMDEWVRRCEREVAK